MTDTAPISREERERMLLRKLEVDETIARLRLALNEAKIRFQENGIRSDRMWLLRTENEIKKLGRESQQIQLRLGKVRIAATLANIRADTFEHRFVEIARRRLTPSFFAELEAEATEKAYKPAHAAEKG